MVLYIFLVAGYLKATILKQNMENVDKYKVCKPGAQTHIQLCKQRLKILTV